jgi:hypothetical protein
LAPARERLLRGDGGLKAVRRRIAPAIACTNARQWGMPGIIAYHPLLAKRGTGDARRPDWRGSSCLTCRRDGYQGPRPGYPWIEFGRISLRVGEAGGPRAAVSAATTAGGPQFVAAPRGSREAVSSATAARPRQPSSVSDAGPSAVALDQPAAGSLAPIAASTDETRLATNALPDLGATVRWNALSDLSATMAALDGLGRHEQS